MTSTLPSRELLNELKLAKSKNSLIFAITEDRDGLSQLLKSNNFDVRLIDLRDNGNLLQMLVDWKDTPDNAVYLIYGISSQFPSVLGYLNLHRDILSQIKRPVLMAVSEYEIREIQKHAPDLYRYRSRTYNFKAKRDIGIKPSFSEPKSIYYKLPIFEEKIDVDAIRERIKLDEYMLGTVKDEYKKAELYMDLAISYFKLDDFDKGDDFSRKSMNIRSQLNDEKGILLNYRRLIVVFLFKNKYERVIELSSLLLKSDPTSASTYHFRGIAYGRLGLLENALECYEKALELNPNNAFVWFGKGLILSKLGRWEEALKLSDKAIEFNPKNADFWSYKGVVLGALDRWEEALEYFEKGLQLSPHNADVWADKGIALESLGRSDEALEYFEKALELDPKNADFWSYKRISLGNVGRWEEALKLSNKAIEINQKNANAWYGKGVALGNLGHHEYALEAFEEVLELDPQNANAWHDKGVALSNLGRHEEALEPFEKAVELGKESATLYVSLARLYRKLGREADSIEACKSARDLIENESEYSRACFEAVCGSPAAALELLRTALEKKEQTADWARRDPDFEFIRDDPRFAALLDEFSAGGEMGP
ncbi:tetratricopeptide repeat protein [Candidatus Methanocrinis natronophilus]|uniref:Tetratricopeptide repeat protein n=1 Tax=Candidatus Methanocrinis natronophilus TaxID=3033396 RepID=A0ABT5X8Y6_9EURY|nr:tetratricopeptide repeat protein [Candidatus Methanocrinis natronophilus]MDF0591042.1 tetratricopeptide repeat protein [Candidatus Methanocrinis natronophilus]